MDVLMGQRGETPRSSYQSNGQNQVERTKKGSNRIESEQLEGQFVILPKWFLPSRLETRTKESNLYASVRVEKLIRGMKVKGAQRKLQHRPTQ